MRLMGLDYGNVHVGVALSDESLKFTDNASYKKLPENTR